ncbi:hypothetical protein NMG60_11021139 [Bertholletia excelsa]
MDLWRKGQISEARRFFDQMADKNVVSWNAMIAAYVQNSQIDEAIRLFKEMPKKDAVSWTTMINGYVRLGKLHEAKLLLDSMPYKNVGAQTAMISGYVQHRRMNEAHHIFNEIWNRDVVCWNTMIAGYANCGRMDEAFNLFSQMPHKNMVSWNTIIHGYAQAGQMDKAVKLFNDIGEKNMVSWNTIVSGYSQNGLYVDALKYFSLMAQDGQKPNQSTFASALSSCANLAALQAGEQIHQIVVKNGYTNDLSVSNSLLSMYAKCGRIFSAELVFDEINSIDIISWNSLIGGYALNGYGEEAIILFQKMVARGVAPDQVTFIGILSACSHSGLVDKALELFRCMMEEFHVEPLPEHYACMVDVFGRAGRLEEAFELVREMKVKANAAIWGALLSACHVRGDLALGSLAAEKLSELEPHKTSNYVILSNMQAEAGRWEEVESMRMLMKEQGVEKQPGCSWIDDKNQLHVFLSDMSQLPEIGYVLNSLSAQMKSCRMSLVDLE